MARRTTSKTYRASGASALPTPIHSGLSTPHSGFSTPLSSAYHSTYASEAEWDPEDDVDDVAQIPISALTLQDLPAGTKHPKTGKARTPKPFRFMNLPSELRIKIYRYHFAEAGEVVDLDQDNYKRIHQKLAILRVCRAIYSEASDTFYSTRAFRVFPTSPGRFFKTKKPLLARLTPKQRGLITSLELRLGPGWSKPPRGWVVNPALGLADCKKVQKLTVFVECDPSDGVFNGFRRADGFYEDFSRKLLDGVLDKLPRLDRVHFDAWTSVKKTGAMMRGLFDVTVTRGKRICWGPSRGWTDEDEREDFKPPTASMRLSCGPNAIAVA